MNRTMRLVVILGIASLVSCDNTFEVNAPKQEIPVVYGLLDAGEETHFIRLERAFISEDVSALEVAQNPDSIYYSGASMTLTDANGTVFPLEMVDATDEGFPRNEGVFVNTPNYIYKIDQSEINLTSNETVTLDVDLGTNEDGVFQVSTQLVDEVKFVRPNQMTEAPYEIVPNRDSRIIWDHIDEEEDRVFQFWFTFYYQEGDPNTGSFEEKSIRTYLGEIVDNDANDDADQLDFSGESLFNLIGSNIETSNNLVRVIGDVEIEVIAGGTEIAEALKIENANTGITSSQESPVFSNIPNGLGIFSSRRRHAVRVPLTNISRDSIRNNVNTRDLNFL